MEEVEEGLNLVRRVSDAGTPSETIVLSSVFMLAFETDVAEMFEVFYLMPFGAGIVLNIDSQLFVKGFLKASMGAQIHVKVVSPQSPLGSALLGKAVHTTVDVRIAGRLKHYTIEGII